MQQLQSGDVLAGHQQRHALNEQLHALPPRHRFRGGGCQGRRYLQALSCSLFSAIAGPDQLHSVPFRHLLYRPGRHQRINVHLVPREYGHWCRRGRAFLVLPVPIWHV